ncbi:hypothetical protein [Nocardioides sp. B-3]|uniref:hypothetical protein n=1 Tax=Nocardioides sp. B-3 TaxID=2895565 RepID=UPI002152E336|nr:hypothetical protein [Nocardioides sp. B-3]UUZ60476.1 hypothetical protein LP418_06225 [Nocardioides sp. B-3]
MTRTAVALAALIALSAPITLAACSTEEQMEAVDPAGDTVADVAAEPGELPTAVPAATGAVTTGGLVTVLDDGDGPELCTFVAESFPPQCSGTPMATWEWADHPEHEDESGTKWGSFALTGTFDGTTFAVTEAVPAALYDPTSRAPEPELTTPCEPPAEGWGVVDPAMATQEAMDATFTAAAALPGYAGSFIDQPDDPAAANDPTRLVINVAVTKDAAGAEAKLRETWGGALCVSEAAYTEAELNELAMELQKLPGVTSSSAAADVVQIGVLYDDGSLQDWADATYGDGRVEITSTLTPVA